MNGQAEKAAETLIHGEPLWVYRVRWVETPDGSIPPKVRRTTFKVKPRTAVGSDYEGIVYTTRDCGEDRVISSDDPLYLQW